MAAYKKKKKREAASAAKLAPEAARAKKNMAAKKVDSGMAEYLKVLAKDPKTIKERKKRSLKNLEESRILELEGDKEDFRSAELRSRQALVEDKESKKQEEKERHMKLVLGDDWKKERTFTGKTKILKNMDKRNRALDPENDPGFLSGLRNKMNIMPTQAEAERRLMARNNARAEQARLSEGEAGGALAGSAAERIRKARMARETALNTQERGRR